MTQDTLPLDADRMVDSAARAAALLRALSHEGRLMILCHLSGGEKSVGTLEGLLDCRQATTSQHLARLRKDGLVTARRDGKAIHYSISDDKARDVVALVYEMFCNTP
jgi:DNA-binding transcriptional ArsR family regulator